MTREKASELLPIITAFAEGETIQINNGTEGWCDVYEINPTNEATAYRIKPTEEYRPYKDCDEMIEDFNKRFRADSYVIRGGDLPLIWIKDEDATSLITDFGVNGDKERVCLGAVNRDMYELLDYFTYLDGSKVGVKVN